MQADAPTPTTSGLDRRSFLAATGVVGLFGLPATAAPRVPGPRVVRHGNVFLVDGWVLTAGDLRALGIAA